MPYDNCGSAASPPCWKRVCAKPRLRPMAPIDLISCLVTDAEDNRFADLLKHRTEVNLTQPSIELIVLSLVLTQYSGHRIPQRQPDNAVKNLTGGDSYPNISVVGPLDPDWLYGFLASAQGGYPLNDVQLNIVDESSSNVCSIELRS